MNYVFSILYILYIKCTVSPTGLSNGICIDNKCECNAGYGGVDCSHECVNRCSSHGTCVADTPKGKNAEEYSCYCQTEWTGTDCSQRMYMHYRNFM